MIEFKPWPKIPRLNRDMIITEKIDGSNAAVGIVRYEHATEYDPDNTLAFVEREDGVYAVYAQSRKLLLTPALIAAKKDLAGFGAWVRTNADSLVSVLGEGTHFGEWWGSGIQRGYGLEKGEKRFSLFNTPRYGDPEKFDLSPLKDIGVDTVPVLWEGPFSEYMVHLVLSDLAHDGSKAAPGFMDPEGIIVFHVAAQLPFKVTIKGDEKPKGSNE